MSRQPPVPPAVATAVPRDRMDTSPGHKRPGTLPGGDRFRHANTIEFDAEGVTLRGLFLPQRAPHGRRRCVVMATAGPLRSPIQSQTSRGIFSQPHRRGVLRHRGWGRSDFCRRATLHGVNREQSATSTRDHLQANSIRRRPDRSAAVGSLLPRLWARVLSWRERPSGRAVVAGPSRHGCGNSKWMFESTWRTTTTRHSPPTRRARAEAGADGHSVSPRPPGDVALTMPRRTSTSLARRVIGRPHLPSTRSPCAVSNISTGQPTGRPFIYRGSRRLLAHGGGPSRPVAPGETVSAATIPPPPHKASHHSRRPLYSYRGPAPTSHRPRLEIGSASTSLRRHPQPKPVHPLPMMSRARITRPQYPPQGRAVHARQRLD